MARDEPAVRRAPTAWLAATRPGFLGITAVAVLVGIATAYAEGVAVDGWRLAATLAGALLVHAGANVVNDYHDRHADAGNVDRVAPFTGGSRMIQDGVFDARTFAAYGYALLGAAAVCGAVLAARVPLLWGLGAAGMLLAIAYSAPPLRLSARGLGEAVIAAAWLLVVIGGDLAQRGAWAGSPVVAGVPVALLVSAILLGNGFPDRRSDASAGKCTLVVLLGPSRAAFAYLAIVLVAHAWLAAAVAAARLPAVTLLALGSLPVSLAAAWRLLRSAGASSTARLRPALAESILAAHLHGLLLAGALLAHRLAGG
jgi:1,4-dihydroxy-2-naphthoate octaprenyltransferase